MGRDVGRDRGYSEQTAQVIDEEVKKLVVDSMNYVRKLLADNRPKLDRLADKLIEKEILDSDEVEALIRDNAPGAVAAS